MDLQKLKIKSRELEPTVIVGKNGLTEGTIEQIKSVLKKKKLIKIKLLRSFVAEEEDSGLSKRQVGEKLAELTNSILVDVVGFTISLAKKF
jgi:RNA-binding protein